MVVVASMATVIASQAVISGAFSISRQAIRLGFLPRLHGPPHLRGGGRPDLRARRQLGAAGRRHRAGRRLRLLDRAGVGLRRRRHRHVPHHHHRSSWSWRDRSGTGRRGRPGRSAAVFLTVEALFFTANLTKIFHGGWLPLVIAVGVSTVLLTWQRGRRDRHRQPHGRGRPVAGVHRHAPRARRGGAPRPGHGRLPQPVDRDHTARDARQRRAQPRPARERRDRLRGVGRRAPRPRLRARRASTTSATPTTASPTSPRASASRTSPTSPRRSASRRPRASSASSTSRTPPTSSHASPSGPPTRRACAAGRRTAVHVPRPQRRQPRRLLRPALRTHRHHGLDDRALGVRSAWQAREPT